MERGTYTYGTGGGGHGAEVEEQVVTAVAPRFLGPARGRALDALGLEESLRK